MNHVNTHEDINQVVEQRTCAQCNNLFDITKKDIAFYRRNNYDLPKRCLPCRKKNRLAEGDNKPFKEAFEMDNMRKQDFKNRKNAY